MRTTRSPVWDYFTRNLSDCSEISCKLEGCGAKILTGSKTASDCNTSNAWTHLKNFHPDIVEKIKQNEGKKMK